MEKELSSYCINDQGVLVYTCGSSFIDFNNKCIEDFNREHNITNDGRVYTLYQYEVMGVGEHCLLHGRPTAMTFGLNYTLVGRCQRGLD